MNVYALLKPTPLCRAVPCCDIRTVLCHTVPGWADPHCDGGQVTVLRDEVAGLSEDHVGHVQLGQYTSQVGGLVEELAAGLSSDSKQVCVCVYGCI